MSCVKPNICVRLLSMCHCASVSERLNGLYVITQLRVRCSVLNLGIYV